MQNRLRVVRKRLGKTLVEVAEEAGMTHATLSRLEKGKIHLKAHQIERLARVLGVPAAEIVAEADMIPVVGYVGVGAEVELVDPSPKGGALGDVPCPRGLNPGRTQALIVRGDSQAPMVTDGWVVYYNWDAELEAAMAVGKLSVVKVADGPVLLKQVKRGSAAGKYHLLSVNAPMIEDVALDWAAPVRAMLPGDVAQEAT